MKRTAIFFLVLASVVLMSCLGLSAQENYEHVIIQVTDQSGAAVPHAQVRLRPQPRLSPKKLETGLDGKLTVALPNGDYAVFATATGFKVWAKKVRVQQGKTDPIEILLVIGSGGGAEVNAMDVTTNHVPERRPAIPVTIEITDEAGAAVPYAQVWVTGSGTHEELESDEQGRLKLSLVRAKYDITVTCLSYKTWSRSIDIGPRTATVRVSLAEMPVP